MGNPEIRLALALVLLAGGAASSQAPAVSDAPVASGNVASLPDGNALVRSMIDRQRFFEKQLDRFAYDVLVTEEELDGHDRVKQRHVRRYEIAFAGGREVRKLVEEGGRPLTSSRLEEEERRARKEAEKAAERRVDHKDEAETELRISDILGRYDFVCVGREVVEGRPVVQVAFHALPGKRSIKGDAVLRAVQGRVWIDEQQQAVRRAELGNSQKIKLGAGLLASVSRLDASIDFVPVDDIWLPRRAESFVAGRFLLLKGIRRRVTREYLNYRRFGVTTQEHISDSTP